MAISKWPFPFDRLLVFDISFIFTNWFHSTRSARSLPFMPSTWWAPESTVSQESTLFGLAMSIHHPSSWTALWMHWLNPIVTKWPRRLLEDKPSFTIQTLPVLEHFMVKPIPLLKASHSMSKVVLIYTFQVLYFERHQFISCLIHCICFSYCQCRQCLVWGGQVLQLFSP